MSGFTIQDLGDEGPAYLESYTRIYLPAYVQFPAANLEWPPRSSRWLPAIVGRAFPPPVVGSPMKKVRRRYPSVAFVIMWLLLQPGENWSWVIIGGFDSREQCQRATAAHVLAPELLLCARTRRAGEEPRLPMTGDEQRATSDGSV